MTLRVGVLSLQGDFREHMAVLDILAAEKSSGKNSVGKNVVGCRVISPADLEGCDALIIPGGESTAIGDLSARNGLAELIKSRIRSGLPVFGTCAGLILLADRLRDAKPKQITFGGLDVTVQRNAFGSQRNSFECPLSFGGLPEPVAGVFIRAPLVVETGPTTEVLCRLPAKADDPAGEPEVVAVRQGSLLGVSFHPELAGDISVHRFFIEHMVPG